MNKKFLSGILCGALLIASASAFVSCKDYDDDINDVQEQINNNKKDADQKYAELSQALKDNINTVNGKIDAINAQIAKIDEAYKLADANLKNAIETEAAARLAADKAAEETAKANLAAAKDYTDQAKAEALAAAQKAQAAAEKFADEAAKALALSEANAAATYATKVELESARTALQAGIDKAQADATSALAKYDELSAELTKKVAELKAAYEAADEKLKSELQSDIADLKAQLAVEVGKLTEADAALEAKIVEANAKIDAANKEIEALKLNIASLESQLKNLNDVVIPEVRSEIAAAKKELEESIAALSKKQGDDVKDLQDAITALKADIALTDKTAAALRTDLTALQETVNALKTRISDIEGAIVGVKNDLAAHIVLFNAFKAETEDNFLAVWDSVAGLDARCLAIEAKAEVLAGSLDETKSALQTLADKEAADVTTLLNKIASEKADALSTLRSELATAKGELTDAMHQAVSTLNTLISTTKSELQGEIATAITSCNTYTNAQIGQLKDYVNAENLKDRGYTDTEIANLKSVLEQAYAAADAATLSSAKAYTDSELQKEVGILTGLINAEVANREQAITALQALLEQEFAAADATTLAQAKAYTDEQKADLKRILEQAIADGDDATAKAAQDALDAVEKSLKNLIETTKSELEGKIQDLSDALDALKEKEKTDVETLTTNLNNAINTLKGLIKTGDENTLDAAKAYADEQLVAAKIYTDSKIKSLRGDMEAADMALGIRIDNVIDAYKEADDAIKKQISELIAKLNTMMKNTTDRFEAAEKAIADINKYIEEVIEYDLYNLITSIVYQGDNSDGSYTAAPVKKNDVPVIYYAEQDGNKDAWPSATVTNHAPAMTAGQNVFQYQRGHFYATVNPSNVNFGGKVTLDLEHSMGEANHFIKLGVLTDTAVLFTKAPVEPTPGLYAMTVLPTEDFNYTQIKNDKALYAMVANWKNAQGDSKKVSATYGLSNFENYCELYPSAKPGKKALPQFKFYTDDTYTTVQGNNPKFSNYEYSVATTDAFPTAYLKLDNEIAQWNYKWYIQFFEYTDNTYTPAGSIDVINKKGAEIDPTNLFENYEDEALDSITYSKSFKLKDADYINKRILVKVSAINYKYEEQVEWTILSFTRPLFDPETLVNKFYPGDKLNGTEKYAQFFFAAALRDSLNKRAAGNVAKYNEYATKNGAVATVTEIATGIIQPTSLSSCTITDNGTFDQFTYNPSLIAYDSDTLNLKDNKATVAVKDNADHDIIVVTINGKILTPKHLDEYIKGADGKAVNRIPASFDFKHRIADGTIYQVFSEEEGNKDMILVWANGGPAVQYDLKGAFLLTNADVPDATSNKGATPWFKGDWKLSNGSVFLFTCANSDLKVNNNHTSHVYTVDVNSNAKSLTLFGSKVVSAKTVTRTVNTIDRVPYDLTRRISYYNMGMTDRYFSAAVDSFKMAFASPINYGLFRASTDIVAPDTVYTIEYSLVKGANAITFENVFPDYSKITSGDPVKFGLKDARISSASFEVTAAGKAIPEYSYLEGASFNASTREYTFTYTNTAAISTFTLPCKLEVVDVYGITTSFEFNLRFLPNKL